MCTRTEYAIVEKHIYEKCSVFPWQCAQLTKVERQIRVRVYSNTFSYFRNLFSARYLETISSANYVWLVSVAVAIADIVVIAVLLFLINFNVRFESTVCVSACVISLLLVSVVSEREKIVYTHTFVVE